MRRNTLLSMSMNRDRSLCLIGGQKTLQLLHCANLDFKNEAKLPTIDVSKNLRSKKASQNFSALDIKWNQKLDDWCVFCAANSAI
jgi:hypothetical protein